jgi:hypothetical protein
MGDNACLPEYYLVAVPELKIIPTEEDYRCSREVFSSGYAKDSSWHTFEWVDTSKEVDIELGAHLFMIIRELRELKSMLVPATQ